MSSIITPEELKQELDQMADGFCQENHVGKITETASYKEFMSEKEKVRRHMVEQRARSHPRQMIGWEDVVAALGVSRSTAYQIIRRLNQELEKAGYITVRGKVSRVYFEKRTYGVDVDAR